MPRIVIENFAPGLDVRRSELAAPPSSLRELTNAHITPGGEIEKREAFQERLDIPADTVGLAANLGKYWVFAKQDSTSTSPDTNLMEIQKLATTEDITEFLDWDLYDEKLYVVIRTATGIKHFYDGAAVSGGKGDTVRTYRTKIHSVTSAATGKELHFSAVGDPTDWSGVGSGTINLSAEDADGGATVGLEVYYEDLAIFSLRTAQLWNVDPDPQLYDQEQILRQAGLLGSRALRSIGDGDVLFVSDTGIRSLRAVNSSLAAAVSDLGSPVDPLVRGWIREMTPAQLGKIQVVLEPITGRIWVVFPQGILVLSYFPSPKILAWSIYQPQFVVDWIVTGDDQVGLRGTDNKLYTYGGLGTAVYDTSKVTVRFPYLHLNEPSMFKTFHGLDITAEGRWNIYMGLDPKNVATRDLIATVQDSTFDKGRISLQGHGTHFGLTFENEAAGPATMANAVMQFLKAEDD